MLNVEYNKRSAIVISNGITIMHIINTLIIILLLDVMISSLDKMLDTELINGPHPQQRRAGLAVHAS